METIIYEVLYNSKDITTDISNYIMGIRYSDAEEDYSDEIELIMRDNEGIWAESWYPTKGDTLSVRFGYSELVDAGTFTIDEIEQSGPPSQITVRGLAAGITSKIRTKQSFGYENKTLAQIVSKVAARNNLTVTDDIGSIQIDRATQYRETDLQFLKRLSGKYGYIFSIRDSTLQFISVFDMEDIESVGVITKEDCTSYSIVDRTTNTYKSAQSAYKNPLSGKVEIFGYDVTEYVDKAYSAIQKVDVLNIRSKAENKEQAEAQAKSELYKANSVGKSCTLTLPGNPFFLAGANFVLEGFGVVSGLWHIVSSTHVISPQQGYTTTLSAKKIK